MILDDFREAFEWLRHNTADVRGRRASVVTPAGPDDSAADAELMRARCTAARAQNARIMSWWDYGYQIAGMANRTTLVDNNTWNNSHIALVGMAMSSNESGAYRIMRMLDADYLLVIFGGMMGYSGDDINKFLWMVRIAQGEHPRVIQESAYYNDRGQYRIDADSTPAVLNSLMYTMSYYRFENVLTNAREPPGYDWVREAVIGRRYGRRASRPVWPPCASARLCSPRSQQHHAAAHRGGVHDGELAGAYLSCPARARRRACLGPAGASATQGARRGSHHAAACTSVRRRAR